METITTTVRRIHFEDFDGIEFERLVFAFLVRTRPELDLTWTGQKGRDGGRDIWGVARAEAEDDRYFCALCANYRTLPFAKIKSDLDKLLSNAPQRLDEVLAVCGGEVGAKVRTRCESYAREKGIERFTLWSGPDFEEYSRRDTPELLRRFVGGEPFPDAPGRLADYARYIVVSEVAENTDLEEPEFPDRLGRWQLADLLGAGGFGSVFAAEAVPESTTPHTSEDEPEYERAAIKIYRPRRDPKSDRRGRARFSHGARVLGELGEKGRHPNVVQLYEGASSEDGWSWIAMELVEGPSLRKAIGKVLALDLQARLHLFLGICHGLKHAHEPGHPGRFFHRDLTPENILLDTTDSSWRPVLVDFDLARGDASTTLTEGQGLVGKAYYVPPEQIEAWEGSRDYSWHRPDGEVRDLWALGMVLFFILTGTESPYPERRTKLLHSRLEAEPAARRDSLVDLVERLLSTEPEQRPLEVAEVEGKIEEILGTCSPPPTDTPGEPDVPDRRWYVEILSIASLALVLWVIISTVASRDREVPDPREVSGNEEPSAVRIPVDQEVDAIEILRVEVAHDRGFHGTGETVAMATTGIDLGSTTDIHPIFEGKVSRIDDWTGRVETTDYTGVGTHEAGLVLAAAPGASLIVQAVSDATHTFSGIPEDISLLFEGVYDEDRVRIHVNGWGSPLEYGVQAAAADEFVWNHRDMVILFSAGNDGIDSDEDGIVDGGSVGEPGNAKNGITVGASETEVPLEKPLTYGSLWPRSFPMEPISSDGLADSQDGLAAFSSRGPTSDGRIKPDLVAPGSLVLSVRSRAVEFDISMVPAPDGFSYIPGTGMATALVAGAAAVTREFLRREHRTDPSAALVKAMLINGAVDLVGQYHSSEAGPIPNFDEGFGRVDIARTVSTSADQHFFFHEEARELRAGETMSFDFLLNSEAEQLKITLVWTDFPGAGLKNDLDLIVRSPDGGEERHGNLHPTSSEFDRQNNVEQVVWDSAPSGHFEIIVRAHALQGPPQSFALVGRSF